MSEVLENIETAVDVAGFIGSVIAKKYGGVMGEAAASYLLGQVSWTAATVDLLAKMQEGKPVGEDVADVMSETATGLAAFRVLAGFSSVLLLEVAGAASVLLIAYEKMPQQYKDSFWQSWEPIFDGITSAQNTDEWGAPKRIIPYYSKHRKCVTSNCRP